MMMRDYTNSMIRQNRMFLRFLTLLLITYSMDRSHHIFSTETFATPAIFSEKGSSNRHLSSLKQLELQGELDFHNVTHATKDFGNRVHLVPSAVLYPKSVSDIASLLKLIFEMGRSSWMTVAAKGHSHSLQGQSQARGGVVINMESLNAKEMIFHTGKSPYVDVSGGELWINILNESLKHGLSPKSWTDYLHLTVGGTLSNAGVSGQAFKHGPQINNVHQLEVVTGTGEVVTCSEDQNPDLFHSVLGGLGQFGIITKARIALEPAPKMAKWIRVLYSEFSLFSRDQEYLISSETTFDYIEGFVMINRTGLLNNWRYFFNPKDPLEASKFKSDGQVLYCLEVVKYFNPSDRESLDQDVDAALSKLNFIRSTRFESEVPYVQFLDRVHASELKLREKGMWDIPHPWLNLLVPRSTINEFSEQVFHKILTSTSNGPIIIYPVNQSRWRKGTSMVTPDEDVFYLVAFLSSAMPNSTGTDGLEYILSKQKSILEFSKKTNLGVKQYLPHYTTQEEWKSHFGNQWEVFNRRKSAYDPLAILAPGQRIFYKELAFQ